MYDYFHLIPKSVKKWEEGGKRYIWVATILEQTTQFAKIISWRYSCFIPGDSFISMQKAE